MEPGQLEIWWMPTRNRYMRRGFALFIVTVIMAAALSVSALAWAQVASDKATARELARSGIRKYREGDAQAAVDELRRAQALYEAPTHLLYLGRASAQLGHLVEAAEYYRTLERMDLDEASSRLFRESQSAGAAELAELLPRIAQLSVNVFPAELEDLEVEVDGKPIRLAALSIERASNPGRHLIEARAPGYQTSTVEIDLAEGESRAVDVVLDVDPQRKTVAKEETKPPPVASASESAELTGPMGFFVGFRAGAILSLGKLDAQTPATDYFYPGPAGRVDLGFRFLDNFGVKGWFGFGGATPGSQMNAINDAQLLTVSSTSKTNITDAGLALLLTSDPRKFGAFAELGFLLVNRYQWSIQREDPGVSECNKDAKYHGPSLHAGGGMLVPLTSYFTLVPELNFSVGRFKHLDITGNCPSSPNPSLAFPTSGTDGTTIANRAFHLQIFLGVGGDFHFGDSLFQ